MANYEAQLIWNYFQIRADTLCNAVSYIGAVNGNIASYTANPTVAEDHEPSHISIQSSQSARLKGFENGSSF